MCVTHIDYVPNQAWIETICLNFPFLQCENSCAGTRRAAAEGDVWIFWCRYHVTGRRGESIITNLVHSTVALMWFRHRASLIRLQRFMAGPGFSEACRGRRMWITAQCSSTVLSRWLHLFWQALDCVWWWETALGLHSAPALQLTMWIMKTWRGKSVHQQTPTPINPSLKGSTAETPDVPRCGVHALQTPAETWWSRWTRVLHSLLFQQLRFSLFWSLISFKYTKTINKQTKARWYWPSRFRLKA